MSPLSRKIVVSTCAVVAGFGLAVRSNGQDPSRDRATPTAAQVAAAVVSPEENDRRIARWLLVGNMGEIELAQLARKHSSNEKVKQFASRMIEDHQKAVDELQSFVSAKRDENTTTTDRNDTRNTAALIEDNGRSRDGAMVFRPVDFLVVKEQVCKSVLNEAKKGYGKMSGAEFDRAYMGMQIGVHTEMAETCKALRGHASKSLQALIDRCHEKTKEHLAHTQQTHEQIKDERSTENRAAN